MISEWFLGLMAGFVGMLGDAFGPWEPPKQLTDGADGVNGVLQSFTGMGVWVEWPVLSACVAVQVGVWLTVLVIKLVRAIAAHVPAVGGAGD